MVSGLVRFEEVIEAVKDETEIKNMRPLYDRVARLIFRAESEIGFGGSVVLKKVVYTPQTTPFNTGKYFPFPEDMIELEGIGRDCCAMFETCYNKTSDGIRFRSLQTKKITLLYWGIFCDSSGRPVTTRNHFEAVVAYVIWKLYRSKMFLGTGNMNANFDFRQEWISAMLEARGDDAFPTLEQWNEIGRLSYSDRRGLLMQPTAGYNYCSDDITTECAEIIPDIMYVYFWQLNGPSLKIEDEIPNLNATYLNTKPRLTYEIFEQGKKVDYTLIGSPVFAIRETEDLNWQITDALNDDVTDEFETQYFPDIKTILFVKKSHVGYSTIHFQFKKIVNNVS